MSFFATRGISLHYSHRPAQRGGRPIVFINSLGTDFRIWNEVATSVGQERPVLLYDKRGHGLSDLGDGIRSIDDHVDDLSDLIDHLGLEDLVLCGLSVGGLIAQGFYARRPEAVKAMILCDTARKFGTADAWDARIATVESQGIEAIADSVLEKWFTPAFHSGRRAELAGYRNMLARQSQAGYCGTCVAIRDADHTEIARRIAVPTLCIAGDQDGSTPPDVVRSLADLIPGARFEIIRGAGHIPCVEQPQALVTLIHDFTMSLPE